MNDQTYELWGTKFEEVPLIDDVYLIWAKSSVS